MINRTNYLFILVIYILLIDISFTKSINTLSNSDRVIEKSKDEDQYYLIYVNNTYGEFNIFSKPKNMKRQELEANKLVFSLVDEIHELIIENKDTFKHPEKVKEIENEAKLKKRNNRYQQYYNYGESDLIYPISAAGNKVVLLAYLSKELSKKVETMDNVTGVSQDTYFKAQNHYFDEQEIEILQETNWNNFTVRKNADLHLSLLSQGKYTKDLPMDYDDNYYYPSSAGKDINIIIIDTSFNFNYAEFSNTDDRTVKCEAVLRNGKNENIIKSENEDHCGGLQFQHGQWVADSAGGLKHGTASRANIYGISLPTDITFRFKFSDIIAGLRYILENMIEPHKTVINISFVGLSDKISEEHKLLRQLIDEITEKGAIIVVAAGNYNFEVDCTPRLAYVPCYFNNTICVGGTDSRKEINRKDVYKKAEWSNYGKEVDIYAPYFVYNEVLNNNKVEDGNHSGTSFASPLTAGIIATIMSDHPEIEFNKDAMLTYLLEKALPFDFNNKIHYMVNNGRHSVYSKNSTYFE